MRACRFVLGLCVLASLGLANMARAAGDVVISQIWGGPSSATGTANQPRADYVELFNRTTSPVSLAGWALNISTSTGTAWVKLDLPAVSIPARSYYLIRVSADATNGTNITPDAAFGTLSYTTLSSTSGKVLLRNTTAAIGAVECPPSTNTVDLVTYSTGTVTCFEGTARAPGGSTSGTGLAIFRRADGCLDTDDNANDFTTRIPAPRNLAFGPAASCDFGACCNNTTGVCVTDNSSGCTSAGLAYMNDGTTCASLPCPPTGACCSGTTFTTCTVLTSAGCAANFYLGIGTVCSPNPCASSSCCFPNGSCCNISPPSCSQQGGTPGTAGISCTTAANCLSAPSNDSCSNPISLNVTPTVTGNLFAATSTGDGPFAPCLNSVNQSSKGVWYTFTPPTTGTYEFTACGSTFDCDVTVFTITACNDPANWVVVGCDDQACPVGTSSFCSTNGNTLAPRLYGLQLTGGVLYYVRMSLNNASATGGGNFTLTVNDTGVAVVGDCCYASNGRCDIRTVASCTDAVVLPTGSYMGDNTTCSPGFCGANYGACCNAGGCQQRLEASCTGGSVFWVENTACFPNPCIINPLPANGTCATAQILLDSDFPFTSLVGINQAPDGPAVSCTNSAPATTRNAIWYSYMPTTNCVLSAWEVNTATALDATVVVYDNGPGAACDSANWTTVLCETEETDANVPLTAGHLYYILIAKSSASTNVNDFYSLKFKITVPQPLPNDSCATATPIIPATTVQSFNAGGAAHGPRSQCQTLSYQPQEGRNAIWFTYTTPANLDQLVRLQRPTNNANNIFFSLQFYIDDCNNLVPYECQNVGTGDTFVRLHRNTTYRIMAHKRSGYLAGDGQYQFIFDVLTPPQADNQDCNSARVIPALPYTDSVNNILAFDETPVTGGNCSGNSVQNASGIWYAFTPTEPTVVTVSETSSQDAAIQVFLNSCTNSILCTALDDETGVPGANTFRAYPGNTYYILVARQSTGLPAQSDTLNISVTGITVPQPTNDDCGSAIVISSIPFSDSVQIGTAQDDTPRAVCSRGTITNTSRNGIWYKYTNGFGAAALVMTETSGLDSIIAVYKGDCGNLQRVMCTDEPEANMYLYMESFTTYYIFVAKASDLAAAASDVLSFNVAAAPTVVPPPLNQFCNQAQVIRSLPFSYAGLPLAATHGPVTTCANQPVSLTCVQSTNPIWYAIDGGSTGFTVRIAETSSNDVTYAIFQDCGGFEQGCQTGDGTPTVPILFTLNPGTRYYIQIARQSNSDYTYTATPYALAISAADGTPGACCTGTACTLSVIESCANRFIPGGVCDSLNPTACCPANFSQTGGVQVQDIFDFLNAWFAGSAATDFNGNGLIEVQDIFDFLNAWFMGC